ncbi:MAG TPA: bifunctional ornithine acetyltransferase/N-acetylglutamate synthase, partial [Nitrospinaceae bacterium]|nr:bifunctional ornithine acetyltransferase/N-acetylglutamate synthase [Nitrospinaceae bacterium]
MVVNLKKPKNEDLHTIPGIQLGTAIAEIKNKGQRDLLIISLPEGSVVAGVFTKNQFCAAPVIVAQENIKQTNKTRALIVNTGSANAGTGEIGIKDARDICKSLAFKLKIKPHEVLPFSTGVIMEPLPVKKIQKKISEAVEDLNES